MPVRHSPPASTKDDPNLRTYSPKPSDIEHSWLVVDAEDLVLGRMATEVAVRLRGKHKPRYAPHADVGDHVIVVNAAKVVMTSDKADRERVWRHSGYPGGIKSTSYGDLLRSHPDQVVRGAVRGMLPKGTLGRKMLSRLKVYTGPTHPHAAQSPRDLTLDGARRRSS